MRHRQIVRSLTIPEGTDELNPLSGPFPSSCSRGSGHLGLESQIGEVGFGSYTDPQSHGSAAITELKIVHQQHWLRSSVHVKPHLDAVDFYLEMSPTRRGSSPCTTHTCPVTPFAVSTIRYRERRRIASCGLVAPDRRRAIRGAYVDIVIYRSVERHTERNPNKPA